MFISEILPHEAYTRQTLGALMLDVREDQERDALGWPQGSIAASLSEFESRISQLALNPGQEILTICAHGRRSLVAGGILRQLGFEKVVSVKGGFEYWCNEGLPITGILSRDDTERYSRHLLLPEIGIEGQKKLTKARVVLIGAGGLGSPAAFYLAAAGVGHLTLIDDDHVDRSNLQRQILHTDARIGMLKTESAESTLSALNPLIHIEKKSQRLQRENIEQLLEGHDLIIDGADNFPTRYLLSAASIRLNLPLIYGAVHRFSGQVSVFDPRCTESPCYRCLFPEPPAAADAPNCAQAGVLGVVPGIIGSLQANETLKLLLNIGKPLIGRLLCFDALAGSFRELALPRDAACPGCAKLASHVTWYDPQVICSKVEG